MPGSLDEALQNLARITISDRGRRLHEEFIETSGSITRRRMSRILAVRPHPYDFHIVYDI